MKPYEVEKLLCLRCSERMSLTWPWERRGLPPSSYTLQTGCRQIETLILLCFFSLFVATSPVWHLIGLLLALYYLWYVMSPHPSGVFKTILVSSKNLKPLRKINVQGDFSMQLTCYRWVLVGFPLGQGCFRLKLLNSGRPWLLCSQHLAP